MDGIHPDPIAQQGTTGFLLGWIDGNNRNGFVGELIQKSTNDLVGDGRFSGSARTGYSQNCVLGCLGSLESLGSLVFGEGDVAGDGTDIGRFVEDVFGIRIGSLK